MQLMSHINVSMRCVQVYETKVF